VQALSVADVAAELARLQAAASAGRLGAADLERGTITVSNIGGGYTEEYVAGCLVE
jgi:2-oxoisovalerate dehydrogenase E2 component (dihydrolipoyl transacylase)